MNNFKTKIKYNAIAFALYLSIFFQKIDISVKNNLIEFIFTATLTLSISSFILREYRNSIAIPISQISAIITAYFTIAVFFLINIKAPKNYFFEAIFVSIFFPIISMGGWIWIAIMTIQIATSTLKKKY